MSLNFSITNWLICVLLTLLAALDQYVDVILCILFPLSSALAFSLHLSIFLWSLPIHLWLCQSPFQLEKGVAEFVDYDRLSD